MKGIITFKDTDKHIGYIQGEDGVIYTFGKYDFNASFSFSFAKVDMQVEFSTQDNKACDIEILNANDFLQDNEFYEPIADFRFYTNTYDNDYSLIDKAENCILRSDRHEQRAVEKLKQSIINLGGNSAMDFKLIKQQRTSMGYVYNYYYAKGRAVVLAKKSAHGNLTYSDLCSMLDHKKIKLEANIEQTMQVSKLAMKIMVVILVIIFAIAFYISS